MNDTLTCSIPVFEKVKAEGGTHSSAYTIVNGKYSDSIVGKSTDRIDLEDEVFLSYSFLISQDLNGSVVLLSNRHVDGNTSRQNIPFKKTRNYTRVFRYLTQFGKLFYRDQLTTNAEFTDFNTEVDLVVQNAIHLRGLEEIKNLTKVNHFVKNLIEYQDGGDLKMATKLIFTEVSNYLSKGSFIQLANFLSSMPFDKLTGKLHVAFLSVTNPWKNEVTLKSVRDNVVISAQKILTQEVGKERTELILKDLK
jgi:hypothetical protein